MTDKKTSQENDQANSPEKKSASATTTPPKISESKATSTPTSVKNNRKEIKATESKSKLSKVGLLALLLALAAIGATAASFYWLNQQRLALSNELTTSSQRDNLATQQSVTQQLNQQQSQFSAQLQQVEAKVKADSDKKLEQLENAVARLEQNKPSDWLIHEAEYLIRIAARTMWLERDTRASINLLKDADSRLAELNSPSFLPVRKLIHQDIEALQLMPVLPIENIVLSLMALDKQLADLPLVMEQVNEDKDTADLALTSDVNDWQDNLAKTWRNFLDTFVVIHIRDGSAKPLLSPQYQQNLKENLSLKLQQAQWAAREGRSQLYLKSLEDIQAWLSNYFDMQDTGNQEFLARIKQLKKELVSFDYPSTLSSLSALHNILDDRPIFNNTSFKPLVDPVKPSSNEQEKAQKEEDKTAPSKLTLEEQIQKEKAIQKEADKKAKAIEEAKKSAKSDESEEQL